MCSAVKGADVSGVHISGSRSMARPLMKMEAICSSDKQLSPTAVLTVCVILVSRLAYSSETSADFHPTSRRYVPQGTFLTVNIPQDASPS